MTSLLSNKLKQTLMLKFSHWEPVYFETALREFERFFELALSLEKPSHLPVSRAIDEIWHACILETREYADLCRSFGDKFLHHESTLPADGTEADEYEMQQRIAWLSSYVEKFGNFSEESLEFWPHLSILKQDFSWPLPHINRVLSTFNSSGDHHAQ